MKIRHGQAGREVERHNVLLYNLYRLVVLTSLLVSAFIIQLSSPDAQPNLPFYYLIIGAYVFSAGFFALYAGGAPSRTPGRRCDSPAASFAKQRTRVRGRADDSAMA